LVKTANKKLGSAALTVAILVIFLIVGLAAFFGLLLAGLAGLLALVVLLPLARLTRLIALLSLSELALLTLFLGIVCHELLLLKARGSPAPRVDLSNLSLSCCNRWQGWDGIVPSLAHATYQKRCMDEPAGQT
jgi:hypothetical protein